MKTKLKTLKIRYISLATFILLIVKKKSIAQDN
jgi:hypothetical protein